MSRTASARIIKFLTSRRTKCPPRDKDMRASLILVASVADQRFALAPEQDQNRRYDADHDPSRQVEATLQIRLPGPGELQLEPVLRRIEAVLIDDRPDIIEPGVKEIMIGDGFRPVIDEKHKGGGQKAQADETKQESDHGALGGERSVVRQPLPFRADEFNALQPRSRHAAFSPPMGRDDLQLLNLRRGSLSTDRGFR